MDSYILGEDIRVMCVSADNFPDGIMPAFEKLHGSVPEKHDRRYFGISRPNAKGEIVYRAAAEELVNGEAEQLGLERFTIPGGAYNTYYIKDYRNHIGAIAECFDLLTGQAETDPNGYCIEWYIGEDDVKCMVRCNDKDYPVDHK
jgi:predicted transcriptional regulator YdeE